MLIFIRTIDKLDLNAINLWKIKTDISRQAIVSKKTPIHFKQSVMADILCFEAAKCFLGENAQPRILRTEHGKPYFDIPNVYISVSHSQSFVAVAIDSVPIGIDIEKIKPYNKKIINKVCSAEEAHYITDDYNRFFEIWTAKEAYLKIEGIGLSKGMKNIFFDPYTKQINQKKCTFLKNDGYICSIVK